MEMNQFIPIGFTSILLLLCLVGGCIADEEPGYLVYIQGGKSTITEGAYGTRMITVQDIVPYVYTISGEKSSLIPLDELNNVPDPLDAVLFFSETGNETSCMVEVSRLSLTDEGNVLTIEVAPLPFYDGDVLTPYRNESSGWDTLADKTYSQFGLYGEMPVELQQNSGCSCTCDDGRVELCCICGLDCSQCCYSPQ